MRTFTPEADARSDGGPTGEWPVMDTAADEALRAPTADPEPTSDAIDPSVVVEVMTSDDFDDRFIVEPGEPLRDGDAESVVLANDVFRDGAAAVVVQRWSRTSVGETDAVVARALCRSAVRHPAVAEVMGLVRTPIEIGVVYDRMSSVRLDRWVADDGTFDRAGALALVDDVAHAFEALRRGGLSGVPLTPDRIGLRWSAPGARPMAVICELEPVAEGGDAVADLAGLLAFCLTGDVDGRVPGRKLRALLARSRDRDAAGRPSTIGAFCKALDGLKAVEEASGARRGLAIAAVVMLGGGVGGGWLLTRPEPAPDTRPPVVVQLDDQRDDAPPPPPFSEMAPLGEAHAKVSARVASGLAALDTLRRADRPKQGRHLLEQLGNALDGRAPTARDRASVAAVVDLDWHARDIEAAASAARAALDVRDDDRLAPALARIYALAPTHVGAAFARRNEGRMHILEEHR